MNLSNAIDRPLRPHRRLFGWLAVAGLSGLLAACGGAAGEADATTAGPTATEPAQLSKSALAVSAVRTEALLTQRTTPDRWIVCAQQSQYCAFSGTRSVRYGSATSYYTATFSNGVACSYQVFGHADSNPANTCSYLRLGREANDYPLDASGSNPPVVVNATTSARAGDVIGLQGENFGTSPRVYLDGAPDSALEIVNRVATGWLAVRIPAEVKGALILRVSNSSGTSRQIKVNVATPLHLDALQLVAGGKFRLFGRNLLLSAVPPRVTIDGLAANVDMALSDEHMLVATAPAGLAPTAAAVVMADNGNGSGAVQLDRAIEVVTTVASGNADPFGLGVGWAAGFSSIASKVVNAASDPRLPQPVVCDGVRDDAPALQGAIELAAASGGGVVRLPAGRCRLNGGMALRSRVVVEGAGKAETELLYSTNYPVFGVNLDLSGVRNLTLTNAGGATEGPLLKDSTRVLLQNVRVRLATSRQMYLSGNRNVVIAQCDFEQTGSLSYQGPYTLSESAGLVFENNNTRWVDGAPAFGRIHDSLLRANRFTRDAGQQNSPGGTVHSMTLDFVSRIAVIGNTFDVANGPITNKSRNDGETILSEGGGAQRTENLGSVQSAGASTLTDSSNTLQVDPFGTGSLPENYGVAIVGGKGAGQTRRLVAYQRPTLTVDRPWDIVPDASSRYATFVWGIEKSLIKGNTLSQNPRGIWLYHAAVRDVDVIGNDISEGGGIYLRSYQNLSTRSFMPIYNVLIGRNRVVNTTGNWMSYINSVFVNSDARAFGIATIGVEMRSNELVANRPNVSSGWEEYANIEGFMNMMRVETYGSYESSAMPRLLGSLVVGNSCNHCEVAVRLGTGAGGTTILGSQLFDSASALADWATTSSSEKSTDTVSR